MVAEILLATWPSKVLGMRKRFWVKARPAPWRPEGSHVCLNSEDNKNSVAKLNYYGCSSATSGKETTPLLSCSVTEWPREGGKVQQKHGSVLERRWK